MSLQPSNAERATRGVQALSFDGVAPTGRGKAGRAAIAEATIELVRDLLHTCDRYNLDLSSLISAATARYCRDQESATDVEPPARPEPGRNWRHWELNRRRGAKAVAATRGVTASSGKRTDAETKARLLGSQPLEDAYRLKAESDAADGDLGAFY